MTSSPRPGRAEYDFVVVSNRLPVDRITLPDGSAGWARSPGGLVTALEPVMRENDGAWVGWAGKPDLDLEPFDADGIHIVPVKLTADDLEQYYEGFSNDTLWPLYHDVIAPPTYHRVWWDSYVDVNRRFAEAAAATSARAAMVWVQDYQLQLVPKMLRELRPDLTIGFFNHIPFPPYGIYSQLPWRTQIVEGVLGADVIGFQRVQDASNFSQAVRRLTPHSTKNPIIEVEVNGFTRTVIAKSFPISIDAGSFEELARQPHIQERAREIRAGLGNPRVVMLGVDRLDYTKGIGHRLKAFGELLADGRLSVEDVTLVQVASPSRERVQAYMDLRDEIELTVGRINGDFSTISHTAISYLHQGYPRDEMVALYLATDVMLVTALRDGMNLVAKEYVASRFDEDGVLILSEFTGAADELRKAIRVNPHDIEGLKSAIETAASMPHRERKQRMRSLRKRVLEYDVARWSNSFIDAMETARSRRFDTFVPSELPEQWEWPLNDSARTTPISVDVDTPPAWSKLPEPLIGALREVTRVRRLLVALDFDGTLAPEVDDPAKARALPEAREAVLRLLKMPNTRVALISGRSLASLELVSDLPDNTLLVGSHGIEIRLDSPDDSVGLDTTELKAVETIGTVLGEVADAVDQVWLEPKPAGFALHTRLAGDHESRVAHLVARSEVAAEVADIHVREGKNVLEFSVRSTTKGEALEHLRRYVGADAVFFAGDDVTDEDAFAALGADDVGLKSGEGTTLANFRVSGPAQVALTLSRLADLREGDVHEQ